MPAFQYRAVLADGSSRQGMVEAADTRGAIATLRATGITLVDVRPAQDGGGTETAKFDAKASAASAVLLGELAVLLRAGLTLDRALALAIENVEPRSLGQRFLPLLAEIREGRPLSAAMGRNPGLFSPTAVAMAEAGEANGRLPEALTRLAQMLESGAELKRLVSSAMIYPTALLGIAVSVVLLMLLFVVPQFESLLTSTRAELPTSSRVVLGASRLLREHGYWLLLGLAGAIVAVRMMLARASLREPFDRAILRVPQLGQLVRRVQTARFARTLGALVEGEVPLPNALALAQRTVSNRHMAAGLAQVTEGVRRGGGLAAPLAAERIVPDLAVGFIRTGEESSELGLMLDRLADVLDRDVKIRLERLVAVLTPAITIVLGAVVTGIVAAVMSAILGFNELAVAG